MVHEHLNDRDIKNAVLDIIRQIYLDDFRPEVVVGFSRGGNIPATLFSQFFDIPCFIINKDEEYTLPQDKKILVVDDINDTGETLTTFNNTLFEENVKDLKYATIVNNMTSTFEVDYYSVEINKMEEDVWIVFPWEDWWTTSENVSIL